MKAFIALTFLITTQVFAISTSGVGSDNRGNEQIAGNKATEIADTNLITKCTTMGGTLVPGSIKSIRTPFCTPMPKHDRGVTCTAFVTGTCHVPKAVSGQGIARAGRDKRNLDPRKVREACRKAYDRALKGAYVGCVNVNGVLFSKDDRSTAINKCRRSCSWNRAEQRNVCTANVNLICPLDL